MANSTSPVPQVVEGTSAVAKVNQLFDAASQAVLGGRNAATSLLLVWGYLGGRIAGINVSNGTLTLGASTTSYVVMKKSDGVVSFSTGTTNWDDSGNYWRLYSVVTDSTTVTSYVDERSSATGIFGIAGVSSPGGSTTQVQYNSAGSLAGSASFTWDNANSRVNTVNITTTGLNLTAASATGGAGFRLPHGVSPTSPTDGDVWTETTGLYARIDGATVGPYATAAGSLTNPMTTAEDMIVGGASGTPTRQGFAANTFPARASTGGVVAKTITDFALTLLDDTDATTMRSTLAIRTPSIQTVTSSATVTPTFSDDMVLITAQAAGLTLANPTGTTSIDGLGIVIRIKDNGTARSIGYDTQYRAIGVTLPTTTVISKTLYLAMVFNNTDTKWDVIAVGQEA